MGGSVNSAAITTMAVANTIVVYTVSIVQPEFTGHDVQHVTHSTSLAVDTAERLTTDFLDPHCCLTEQI